MPKGDVKETSIVCIVANSSSRGYDSLQSEAQLSSPARKTNMDQNDSIDDKRPKKKRVGDTVYYVVYIFILALIGATVFFLYKLL